MGSRGPSKARVSGALQNVLGRSRRSKVVSRVSGCFSGFQGYSGDLEGVSGGTARSQRPSRYVRNFSRQGITRSFTRVSGVFQGLYRVPSGSQWRFGESQGVPDGPLENFKGSFQRDSMSLRGPRGVAGVLRDSLAKQVVGAFKDN